MTKFSLAEAGDDQTRVEIAQRYRQTLIDAWPLALTPRPKGNTLSLAVLPSPLASMRRTHKESGLWSCDICAAS